MFFKDQSWIRKRVTVLIARRCTFRCPPTRCMCAPTIRDASVSSAASASQGPGSSRATSAPTQAKSPSSAASARRRSPTRATCAPTSRPTRTPSHTHVRDAARPSLSSPTCTSTRSHRAWRIEEAFRDREQHPATDLPRRQKGNRRR